METWKSSSPCNRSKDDNAFSKQEAYAKGKFQVLTFRKQIPLAKCRAFIWSHLREKKEEESSELLQDNLHNNTTERKLTASLEITANSPGLTPWLANSLAAYPYTPNKVESWKLKVEFDSVSATITKTFLKEFSIWEKKEDDPPRKWIYPHAILRFQNRICD